MYMEYDSIEELLEHRSRLENEHLSSLKEIFHKENLLSISQFFEEHLELEHLSSFSPDKKKHIQWKVIKAEHQSYDLLMIQNTATSQCLVSLLGGEETPFLVLLEQKEKKPPEVSEDFSWEADEIHPFLYFVHSHEGRHYFFNRIEKEIVMIDLERTCVQKVPVDFDYPVIACSKLYPDEKDIPLPFPLYEHFHFASVTAHFLKDYSFIPMYFLFSDQCYDTYALPASGDGRIYLYDVDSCSLIPIQIPVSADVIRYSHAFLGSTKKRAELIIGVDCWLGGEKQEILLVKVDPRNQSSQVLHRFSWSDAVIFELRDEAVSPDDTKILILVKGTKVGSNDRISELYVMSLLRGEVLLVRGITGEEEEKYHQGNHDEKDIGWIDDHTIKFYHQLIQL